MLCLRWHSVYYMIFWSFYWAHCYYTNGPFLSHVNFFLNFCSKESKWEILTHLSLRLLLQAGFKVDAQHLWWKIFQEQIRIHCKTERKYPPHLFVDFQVVCWHNKLIMAYYSFTFLRVRLTRQTQNVFSLLTKEKFFTFWTVLMTHVHPRPERWSECISFCSKKK